MRDTAFPNVLKFPVLGRNHSFPTGASKAFGIPVRVLEHVQLAFRLLDLLLKHGRFVQVLLNGCHVKINGVHHGLSCGGSAGNGAIRSNCE